MAQRLFKAPIGCLAIPRQHPILCRFTFIGANTHTLRLTFNSSYMWSLPAATAASCRRIALCTWILVDRATVEPNRWTLPFYNVTAYRLSMYVVDAACCLLLLLYAVIWDVCKTNFYQRVTHPVQYTNLELFITRTVQKQPQQTNIDSTAFACPHRHSSHRPVSPVSFLFVICVCVGVCVCGNLI